ncbi:MAG: iron-containing alcohol dehydrogenase [Candidatus Saccharicenans sp.]|uniref:iron-containing alcohol dehydrogenase n=1 Tax=Candidatus Saccharicenans sp. TaxID=2819258 RepID=UPI00404990D0
MLFFNYLQPTEILFGAGRLKETGKVSARFGRRCLLVTVPSFPEFEPALRRLKSVLRKNKLEVEHFDQVVPNPTVEVISSGARVARKFRAELVIGLGGGSSIDSAKAIAVEATHKGSCWDYLYFRETQPTERTLPIVAIPTTSGTGSHVTQVAVVTNPEERNKSALYNSRLFPRVAIVDPELMLTLPSYQTAITGFDAFCHAFESYITPKCSPYIEILALECLRLVAQHLPVAVKKGDSLEVREKLAWADTLAGLSIANSAVTLPHGIAMALSGLYPSVAHGQALASVYPSIMRYTYRSATKKFATVARILNPALQSVPDKGAARQLGDELEKFIKVLGIKKSLRELGVIESELKLLARSSLVLPDYRNHPYVVSLQEVEKLLRQSY